MLGGGDVNQFSFKVIRIYSEISGNKKEGTVVYIKTCRHTDSHINTDKQTSRQTDSETDIRQYMQIERYITYTTWTGVRYE